MKLASYVADGKECYGAVVGDGVVTLKGHASLRDALAAGALDGMKQAATAKPDHKLADIRFLPVIPNPYKILCAGETTGHTLPRWAANCRSSRACSFASPIRWSATRAR
jgi:hypothetical protein